MPEAPRADRYDFLLAAAAFAAIALAHGSYVPLWDGAFYLRCLQDAFGPWHGAAFLYCANHPTGGYLAPLALAFQLSGMRYPAVIAVNVLLGVLAAHSVSDLSALMFPSAHRAERALVTLGFALSPLLLACALHLTPDYGVALYALLTVRALARQKLWLAALFGALASQSKETGAPIFLVACAAHALVYVAWAPGDRAARRRALLRYLPLLLGFALCGVWLGARALLLGERGAWKGVGAQYALWRHALSISWLDNVLPSQLAEVFVINFAWVLSAFVLMGAVGPAWRFIVRAPADPDGSDEAKARAFFTLTFIGTLLVVTRFRTFVFPRYVLPAVVLLPLMAQRSLHSLRVTPRLRLLLLGASAALSLFACFRTRDAFAMSLFGTFEWGERRVLDLASLAGDLNGRREHLVYNLEFTRLSTLLDRALPYALDDGRHGLALNRQATWLPIGFVDRRTLRRTASTRGASVPRVSYLPEIQRGESRPQRLFYLELPGMDDDDELILWRRYYRVGEARRFTDGGYSLGVRELLLRDDAPAPDR
ncbi:MAG: hypothetical protein EPO40_16375 [Myxococcaceae bacterium]|nr:MAG: hypothetical protein EPO40_16375 [Myxococcaceae bacterium]